MARKVIWVVRARRDLDRIVAFVGDTSPQNALMLLERLLDAGDSLAEYPWSGHIVEEPEISIPGLRKIPVLNHRLFYRVTGSTIEIEAILHGSRQLPAKF